MGFTLTQVKAMAVDILHRSDVGALLDTALQLGYLELQKAGDYNCQEATSDILTVNRDTGAIQLPDDFKKPQNLFRIGEDGKRSTEILRSTKNEVDAMEMKRAEFGATGRAGEIERRWYIRGSEIRIFPWNPTATETNPFRVELDYWAFLKMPDADKGDFFTNNGPLALAYYAAWYGSLHLWQDDRAASFGQAAALQAKALKDFDDQSTAGPSRAYRPPLTYPTGRRRY